MATVVVILIIIIIVIIQTIRESYVINYSFTIFKVAT